MKWPHLLEMRVERLVTGSIGGHLRNACAGGDAAAVAQLERLVRFAGVAFINPSHFLQYPMLLRSLLGNFRGRAVTPGCLAEELGLPWHLLQRLFLQRAEAMLADSADSHSPEAQQVRREELLSYVQDALALARNPAATAQQLRFAAHTALLSAMSILKDEADSNGAQLQGAEAVPDAAPEVLPEEDASDAAIRRQLRARLAAGELSIPMPKQVQLGPLPLWQQCLLELVSHHLSNAREEVACNGLSAYLTSGMLVADSPAAAATAGHITPLQRLLGDAAFVTGPPVTPQPLRLPWGRLVAQAAVELRRPQLLAWALQPEQRAAHWGC
ncbi:hypothetical protein OEZ86_001727 [Tetradesmus obliquus]|nr:hypothetical protein OEZ86_001727 [Tetradesmus obliquus]